MAANAFHSEIGEGHISSYFCNFLLYACAKCHACIIKRTIRPYFSHTGLNIANYRPISTLCFLSKTLERVVAKQIATFLANNNLIDVFHSAYLAHHNVETALLNVHNDLLQAMNCGKITLLVLLDLLAAFTTVDHSILLSRMNSYFGIGGVALDWFQSYLSVITYRVCVDNVTSDISQLKHSIKQGSLLRPILFSVYPL